eukprot:6955310-Pyramimonas_sp.AAC.1
MGIMALFRAGTTLLIIGVVGGSALSEDHANTHLGTSGECFEHAETKCLWFVWSTAKSQPLPSDV